MRLCKLRLQDINFLTACCLALRLSHSAAKANDMAEKVGLELPVRLLVLW